MKNIQSEIYPVMLTPFQDNNKIDFEALKQLTEFYIATGSTGLFANCLSSEMFQLNDNERIQVTKTVVDQVNGRQKVIATGTFGYNLNRNIEFVKKIYDEGVYAVIINTNQLVAMHESDDAWKMNMGKLLDETGNIPLGVYECPVPYKRLLSPDLVKWMGKTGRFHFLKDTSCDLGQIKLKLEAAQGTSFQIYNANIPTCLSSLKAGAKGIASIASNLYPELIYYLTNNFNSENDKIEKLNAFLTIMDPLIHEFYPMSAKYFLKLRGMKINTNTRVPMGSFTHQDFVKSEQLHRVSEILAEELGIDVYRF